MSDVDTIREVLSVWGQDTLEMDGYCGPDAHTAEAALASLESQNQALQEALAFYAEPRNHEWQQIEHENGERYTKASSLVDEDAGARARDALSQETEAE